MLYLITEILLIFFAIITFANCDAIFPRIIKHPKSLIIVNETDPITIECQINLESKSNVLWFKDGQKINYNNKYQLLFDNNLFIATTSNSDAGVYYCKAQNNDGFVFSSNATVVISYLKDEFRATPKNRQITLGSNTIFECKAPRGIPEPMIFWEKDGYKLKIDDKHYLIEDNSLQINNVTTLDSGQYICVAKNEAGIRRTRSAFLNVYDKPSFVRKPQSNKYSLNSKIELICEAKGFPEPQIEWFKDNTNEIIKKGNLFLIQNAKIEDAGEYKCKAFNSLGIIETKAKVTVYEKPSFVKTLPNYTTGFESKSLTIECNAKGYPPPMIYWAKSTSSDLSRNNQNLQDDFIILENGNLFIERLTKKYEGTYLCQANNEYGSIEMKTVVQMKQIQTKPPPIISYGPQNQTIPINTQAILECKTTGSDTKPVIIWHKGAQQITLQQYETRKYSIEESGSLVINSVQKSDTDFYKCVVTNSWGQTVSSSVILKVEDPNDPYVEFKRNYDASALPSACGQPTVLTTTSNSIQLTWQSSSYPGRSRIISYRIEYFSPEWPRNSLGWVVLADDIPAHKNFYTVNNLQSDTYYLFIVRARNEQGFGPPSPTSDLVKTLFEPQVHFRDKNSNELLEKALSGEIVQLNEPDVLTSTSLNITWKVFKSMYLIEGFIVKFKPTGTSEYKSEKLADNKKRSFVLNNLLKFTNYEIIVEPYNGVVHGSESNVVQAKTKEDVPEHGPLNLNIEIESTTSISIKWEPPPNDKINGIILGYKINCIANETKYNIHLNTNSTTRAIILENLIEGMKYCIKVAAYTKVDTGPFTQPFKCIEMTETNLLITERTSAERFREIISEPWFIAMSIAVLCTITLIMSIYCFWCLCKRFHKRKYTSSTSSEITLDTNKTNNGNRYKLVNDAIWMDTLHSSNNSNQEFCCVPDMHHQLFIQKQNDSNSALHDLNVTLENRLQNTFRNTLVAKKNEGQFPITNASNANRIVEINNLRRQNSIMMNNANSQPQYAEIYSPNHYASTGLFNENFDMANASTNSRYLISSPSMEKKYKAIITNPKLINTIQKDNNGLQREITEKELLKYIQATQSQTNTPKIPVKFLGMQSIQRVKSMENHHKIKVNGDSVKVPNTPQLNHKLNQSSHHPPPPPNVPPPSNYLRGDNDAYVIQQNPMTPVHYNAPWNNNPTTMKTSTLSRAKTNENTIQSPIQNYMIIDENSQKILLNQLYQQQQQQQHQLQFNHERLFNIISLPNDIAQTLLLNDISNLNNQNLIISNHSPNQITEITNNNINVGMHQSWASTTTGHNVVNQTAVTEISENTHTSSNDNNMNNSVATVSSSSNFSSSNCENEDNNVNEYATYLSTMNDEDIQKYEYESKQFNYNRSKLDMLDMVEMI